MHTAAIFNFDQTNYLTHYNMKSLFILILGFGVLYPTACSKSNKKPSGMKPEKQQLLVTNTNRLTHLI